MSASRPWLPTYRSRLTRRAFLRASAAGAGAAALIACGGDGGGSGSLKKSVERTPGSVLYSRESYLWPDDTKNAVAGGTFPGLRATDAQRAFDPYLGGSQSVDDEQYEFLMFANRGPGIARSTPEYVTPQPGLAEAFEVSNDGLTYTFTMRRGVKFHPVAPVNGREMNIEDWKASLTRYEAVHIHRSEWLDLRDKVEFTDARTMVVKLKEPYGPFAARMAPSNIKFIFQVMPKELHDDPNLAASTIIGTAYRRISSYQPAITVDYVRNDDYWQGKPFIERWREPIIPEAANRFAQFVAKNIITFSPAMHEALTIKRENPEALMIAGENNPFVINRFVWGKREKDTVSWGDPRVRIAMHRAVNYDAILDFRSGRDAFRAEGIEIDATFTTHAPNDPLYWLDPRKGDLGKESENYLYDVAAAKQLMGAAGYADGVDIPLLAESGTSGAGGELWTIYHDEIKKTGLFRFQIELMQDSRAYRDRVFQSNDFKGRSWVSSGGEIGDFDYHLSRQYRSSGATAAYTSPKMDELYTAQRRESDPAKRAEYLKDLQRESAKLWPVGLGDHQFASWRFEWAWQHNAGYPSAGYGHLHWLDANMPKRNG